MTPIEDELRAVLDGFSIREATETDRRAQVGARISHRRRMRTTAAAAALMVVAVIAGGTIITGLTNHDHRALPAVTTEPAPGPGRLGSYEGGGKVLTYASAMMPAQTTISLTFTPTSWNFLIGEACSAPGTDWISVSVNGRPLDGSQCSPGGGVAMDEGGEFDTHQQFWTAEGVRLGERATVTATIGTSSTGDSASATPTRHTGVASIGVYLPVPWDAYRFPSRPAGPLSVPEVGGDNLPPLLATLSGTASSTSVTLPAQIIVNAAMAVPGLMSIYLNGVQIEQCDVFVYSGGCSGGTQTVGTGRLAGFTVGQRVTFVVVRQHLAAGDSTVWLYGS